jgi:hypothetical protein
MELPDLAGRAELVRRYAHLLQHFGSELGKRPLVLQNAEFFPDAFAQDEASVLRLVRRLQGHAGLSDIPIQVRLVSADAPQRAGGSCGSGACAPADLSENAAAARLEEQESGWILNVFDVELHHPVALTTQLSRALARIFLHETSGDGAPIEAPLDISTDLTAVALGFGTLLLEGSFIYTKSCGGPSVTCLTTLSVGELAVACSLFIALGGHSGRRALGELGTTQRALLSEANAWAKSNAKIVRQLAADPGQLAVHAPELSDVRPWLVRLFDRPSEKGVEDSLERALAGELGDAELRRLAGKREAPTEERSSRPRDARREELKALVDEALRSS